MPWSGGRGQASERSVKPQVPLLPPSQATIVRRSILVVRHGERVDQIFGKSWLQQCTTPDGKYSPGRIQTEELELTQITSQYS